MVDLNQACLPPCILGYFVDVFYKVSIYSPHMSARGIWKNQTSQQIQYCRPHPDVQRMCKFFVRSLESSNVPQRFQMEALHFKMNNQIGEYFISNLFPPSFLANKGDATDWQAGNLKDIPQTKVEFDCIFLAQNEALGIRIILGCKSLNQVMTVYTTKTGKL